MKKYKNKIKYRDTSQQLRLAVACFLLFFVYGPLKAQVDAADVQIYPSPYQQTEVHISISKADPTNLVLSCNAANQGVYTSRDGGATWTGSDFFPNNAQVCCDPSTAIDADGRIYVASIANNPSGNYALVKSADKGITWTGPVYSGSSSDFDKDMITVDNSPTSPYRNYFHATWTDFGTYPITVKYNRSPDQGNTFSTPIILRNGWGQGTNVQTGPNGEVYVCYAYYSTGNYPADSVGFHRSVNGGVSFSQLQGFGYTGIRTSNSANPDFGNIRVNDFPAMAVDKSFNSRRGRIYIVYAENVGGKAVIRLRSSSDQGTTWTAPVTVSIPCATQAWFPWISADDITGDISIIYYAMDNPSVSYSTNTYVAHSRDGGATFTTLRVSDVPHITSPAWADYAGDYIGIAAYNNKAYAAWVDNRTGTYQAYVSQVDYSNTATKPYDLYIAGPVTVNSGKSLVYTAVNTITVPTTSTYTVSSGAKVIMSAGSNIRLLPGFSAASGSNFNGYIDVSCAHSGTRLANIEDIPAGPLPGDQPDILAYPNPFDHKTRLEYKLDATTQVHIALFNSMGEKVADIVDNALQEKGMRSVDIDASRLPGGIYIYTFSAGNQHAQGKLLKLD